jgi:hypothetical protein
METQQRAQVVQAVVVVKALAYSVQVARAMQALIAL